MLKYCFAALLVIVAPSFALANGGGGHTKNTGTIRIINDDQDEVVGVIINPSDAVLDDLEDDPSPENLQELGGKFVNPGQSIRITKVKTGPQRVVYFYDGLLELSEATVTVKKGATSTLRIPPLDDYFTPR